MEVAQEQQGLITLLPPVLGPTCHLLAQGTYCILDKGNTVDGPTPSLGWAILSAGEM